MKTVKSKVIFFVLTIVIVAILSSSSVWPVRNRLSSEKPACREHLKVLQSCKINWLLDYNKTTNDIPSWDDINYMLKNRWVNGKAVCPQRGTYTLGRVGEAPTCSIGGTDHSLPDSVWQRELILKLHTPNLTPAVPTK